MLFSANRNEVVVGAEELKVTGKFLRQKIMVIEIGGG